MCKFLYILSSSKSVREADNLRDTSRLLYQLSTCQLYQRDKHIHLVSEESNVRHSPGVDAFNAARFGRVLQDSNLRNRLRKRRR